MKKLSRKIIVVIVAGILFSCNNLDQINKELSIRVMQIENQNDQANKNVENLYVYFDWASINHLDSLHLHWDKALALKLSSYKLLNYIDTLKESLKDNDDTIPFSILKEKIKQYKEKISSLPDSLNGYAIKTMDFEVSIQSNQSKKNELTILDLTILQSWIINTESVILMSLCHDLRPPNKK